MKNQNDLIVSIAAVVLAIGFILGFVFVNPRQIVTPPAPTPVPTDQVNLPAANVTFANALPGGSGQAGGFGAAGGPGMMSGPPGGMMGGPPMGSGAPGGMGMPGAPAGFGGPGGPGGPMRAGGRS